MEIKEYTSYQRQAMWEIIKQIGVCPNCFAKDSMLLGPRGGSAFNIKCRECGQIFFITAFRDVGAWPITETKEVKAKCQTI